ncbi:MAG: hypothetical protein LBI26_03025 [Holosporales bacterium]|nr:hypothetical protein [Holosporales bacterium]
MNVITTALALSQFAPMISRWVGGKRAENAANTVLAIAKEISGARNAEEAIKKLEENSKLAFEFRKAIIEAEKDIELAVIKDKESARKRDIAIINTGRRNKRADIMVIAAAIGLIICLAVIALYKNNLPGEAVGIISTIAGIFGSCLKDAYNFEFGSSRGSKEKDQTVASIINKV